MKEIFFFCQLLTYGPARQEKKVADLGTFGGFVLNFTMFIN